MALFFTVNKTPANHVGSVMYLWQTMVNAGWLVLSYSDGLQTVASGSPGSGFLGFATASDGTPRHTAGDIGGANNSRAWILLTQPIHPSGTAYPYSGSRQFTFQKSTNATNTWRIKYSSSGGYWPNNGGAGTATATPVIATAVNDEAIICGGGSDASPTFGTFLQSTNEGASRTNCAASDGLSGSAAPYGFYMIVLPNGGGNVRTAFVFDPMSYGSAAPGDLDPFMIYSMQTNGQGFFVNSDYFTASNNTVGLNPRGWLRRGQSDQAYQSIGACWYATFVGGVGNNFLVPNQIGGNSQNSFDDVAPIVYMRQPSTGGLTGYKGVSALIRWNAANHVAGETLSLTDPGTTRDRICFDDINLPWDGVTVPLI